MNLLIEELQEYLEPHLRNSFAIFHEVSKPVGCEDAAIIGFSVLYKRLIERVGCEYVDCGHTPQGVLVVMFSKDNQNYAARVGRSESTGELDVVIDKRDSAWHRTEAIHEDINGHSD